MEISDDISIIYRAASQQKTPEGHNVHSFRGLLECLGTLCRHKIELSSHKEIHYYKESKANKLQERALAHLSLFDPKINFFRVGQGRLGQCLYGSGSPNFPKSRCGADLPR